jgi:hypothetical protein
MIAMRAFTAASPCPRHAPHARRLHHAITVLPHAIPFPTPAPPSRYHRSPEPSRHHRPSHAIPFPRTVSCHQHCNPHLSQHWRPAPQRSMEGHGRRDPISKRATPPQLSMEGRRVTRGSPGASHDAHPRYAWKERRRRSP